LAAPSVGTLLPTISSNQPALLSVAVAGVDVAAIDADRERAIRPRERIPITLAALNEKGLLIAELTLKPLGHLLRMSIDCGLVRLEWQQLL